MQELPEELPPGQLPRFFDVDVVGDIVNTARPGDRLVLTGIVRAEQDITPGQARTRVFRSKIDSNLIEVAGKDPGQIQISKEDEFLIRSVAANPDAYQRLIKSIAPAILGHDAVKEAILLLLVGRAADRPARRDEAEGGHQRLHRGRPGRRQVGDAQVRCPGRAKRDVRVREGFIGRRTICGGRSGEEHVHAGGRSGGFS